MQCIKIRSYNSALINTNLNKYIEVDYPKWLTLVSSMTPSTEPVGSPVKFIISASVKIISIKRSKLILLRAEMGTICTSPPLSST